MLSEDLWIAGRMTILIEPVGTAESIKFFNRSNDEMTELQARGVGLDWQVKGKPRRFESIIDH